MEGSVHSPGRAPQGADLSLMPPRIFHIEGLDSRLAKNWREMRFLFSNPVPAT